MNNTGMHTTDVWEIVTALSTMCAVIVALIISLTQIWRDACKARRIRHAISPALIDDLETIKEVLKLINEAASHLFQVRMTNAHEASKVISLGNSLIAPSFDKFKDILPDLGSVVAPNVIKTYGKIIRITALTRTYRTDIASLEQASNEIAALQSGSKQLVDEIKETITLLKRIH